MSTPSFRETRPKPISSALHRHPKGRLAALLTLPMVWLVGVYILAIILMLITAFWETDPFTSKVKPGFTLKHFTSIVTVPAYLSAALRTLGIALAVTAICAVLAVPLAIYMAKIARPWQRAALAVMITLPLWAGYLVKILSVRIVFSDGGFINSVFGPLGIHSPGYGVFVTIIALVYLWFPYMAIPVYTAVSQVSNNLFDASADLGARGMRTIFTVVIPLLKPALIAGSIFTFSLSLGDYLAAKFVGGSTQMIGTIIASNINLNPPVAAAFSVVPIVIVVVYLLVVRKSGAIENI
ncbi:putative spermidine/putrescine transport system permease protein [Leucobacter exalbidus]|uniref:Spermidine/putrescine transport system permease protein n=1 Tax=Leucobacter exalbidus TaxID=662960 RepID=A0A940T3V8_9MICO|nr:putative spermidine/putrescine transport system permease protein [Leucobacter exalbidus]